MSLPLLAESLRHQIIELKPVNHTVGDVFKGLFYQHFTNLCDYALTIVKDADQAKDIVQGAYTKLWEKRSSVDLVHSGKSYLYTTVYRSSLNFLRNEKTKKAHHQHLRHQDMIDTRDHTLSKEVGRRMHQAIDLLPLRCREIFLKAKYEGKTYQQISGELGLSVKTVEGQMGKALKFLRDHLRDLMVYLIIHLFGL